MKQESMEYAKKILLDVIEKSGGNIIFEHTKRSKWSLLKITIIIMVMMTSRMMKIINTSTKSKELK